LFEGLCILRFPREAAGISEQWLSSQTCYKCGNECDSECCVGLRLAMSTFCLTDATANIRILNNYGTLWVTGGDFYWTGGKFQPSVNCAGAGPWQADAIEVGTEDDNWKLHVGGTATVEVTAFNVPPGGLPANFRASVIKAWGGILGIGQLPPSLTLVNPQGVTFQLDLANLGPNGKSYDLIPG
jgi:hypothetical protein